MSQMRPQPTHPEKLIAELGLTPLAGESGYIGYISTSHLVVEQDGQKLRANDSIYYLLDRERSINYLHWLAPDDTHILLDGGPVHYYEFREEEGRCVASHHLVGKNVLKGERPVLMIPGGSWKALVLPEDVEYALLATILTPQWTDDPARLKIGAGQKFIDRFQNPNSWATAAFLKKLIGPNFHADTPHR
ncbi:MAG: cupin domain-containing protein [Sideroxydans sp.]|nr:cupin domain-containing protein [Sideroxydans sp.]